MKGPLGRTGTIFIIIVIGILLGEDILIFYKSGALPAIEFLLLDALVIGVLAIGIREARRRTPP